MKFARTPVRIERRSFLGRGFTLIEVLAALLLMAIVIPVALQAISTASRAGTLGQRKAAAMRVAERMIDELIVTGQTSQNTASGTTDDGDMTYTWSMQTTSWTEDSMTQMTVKVVFTLQGNDFEVSASTLFDPNAGAATTSSTTL
jgi:type II secretion system protein I